MAVLFLETRNLELPMSVRRFAQVVTLLSLNDIANPQWGNRCRCPRMRLS